jgi:predicted DNA-binding transcriptional regulator AlpA
MRLQSLQDLARVLGRSGGSRVQRRPDESQEAFEHRRQRAALAATRAFVDREEKAGRFPKRVRLTPQARAKDGRPMGLVRWDENEVQDYLQKLLNARDEVEQWLAPKKPA